MNPKHPPRAEDLLAQTDWIRGLARTLVGESDADDLVQDTLAVSLPADRPTGSSLRPWLATVTRNLARNRFRGQSRRAVRERAAARPEELADTSSLVERAELLKSVVDRLLALPERQREAVYLRYVEGLRPKDIAGRLRLSGSTVRTRLHDGLERLRRDLDDEHGGDRRAWCALLAPIAATAGGAPAAPAPLLAGGRTVRTLAALTAGIGTLALVPLVLDGNPEPKVPAESRPATPAASSPARGFAASGAKPAGTRVADPGASPGDRRSVGASPVGDAAGPSAGELAGPGLRLVSTVDGTPLGQLPVHVFGPADDGPLEHDAGLEQPEVEALGALGYARSSSPPERIAAGVTDPAGRFECEAPRTRGPYRVEALEAGDPTGSLGLLWADGPWPAPREPRPVSEVWTRDSDGETLELALHPPLDLSRVHADATDRTWFCGLIGASGSSPLNDLTREIPADGSTVWPRDETGGESRSIPVVFDHEGLLVWEGSPGGAFEDIVPSPRARVDLAVHLGTPPTSEVTGVLRVNDAEGKGVLLEVVRFPAGKSPAVLPLRWLRPGTFEVRLTLAGFDAFVGQIHAPPGRTLGTIDLVPWSTEPGALEIVIVSRTGTEDRELRATVSSIHHPSVAGGRPIVRRAITPNGHETRIHLDGLHRREYLLKLSSAAAWGEGYVGVLEPERRVLADGREVRFELLDDVPRADLAFRVRGPNGSAAQSSVWLFSEASARQLGSAMSEDGEFRFERVPFEPGLRALVLGEGCQARVLEIDAGLANRGTPIQVDLAAGRFVFATAVYADPVAHWKELAPLEAIRFANGDRPLEPIPVAGMAVLNFEPGPFDPRAFSQNGAEFDPPVDGFGSETLSSWEIQLP